MCKCRMTVPLPVVVAFLVCLSPTRADDGTPSDRQWQTAAAWVRQQTIDYRIPITYEFGSDVVRKKPPRGALSLRSFELPPAHTHYRFLGRYGRTFAYDHSLGVIFYTLTSDYARARGLLLTLEHLQLPNGSATAPGTPVTDKLPTS